MGGNDEQKDKGKSRHGKVRVRRTTRPSGHNIKSSFGKVDFGSIPPNMLEPEPPTDLLKFGNHAANDLYTERCKDAGLDRLRQLEENTAAEFVESIPAEWQVSAVARQALLEMIYRRAGFVAESMLAALETAWWPV